MHEIHCRAVETALQLAEDAHQDGKVAEAVARAAHAEAATEADEDELMGNADEDELMGNATEVEPAHPDSSEGAQARIALMQTHEELVDEFERQRRKEKETSDANELREAERGLKSARALILDAVAALVEPTKQTRDRHQAARGTSWSVSSVLPSLEQVDAAHQPDCVPLWGLKYAISMPYPRH